MTQIIDDVVQLWSDVNPPAGYTGGYLDSLTGLFFQTPENLAGADRRIAELRGRLDEIESAELRFTAGRVLTALQSQLALARPSGAGPSGTGAGGVYSAADGIFYLVLKQDGTASWVPGYLDLVREMVELETERWRGGWNGKAFTIEVRKECLDTASYLRGTLQSLQQVNPDVGTQVEGVEKAYLNLYGSTPEEQARGVLGAQLETYVWRVIRYVRALCDVHVNSGRQTYTDFIAWAAQATGLSEETLHGECFTFLAAPGYAPCYALGGATYGYIQSMGVPDGVTELDFNTFASGAGFNAWSLEVEILAAKAGVALGAGKGAS